MNTCYESFFYLLFNLLLTVNNQSWSYLVFFEYAYYYVTLLIWDASLIPVG